MGRKSQPVAKKRRTIISRAKFSKLRLSVSDWAGRYSGVRGYVHETFDFRKPNEGQRAGEFLSLTDDYSYPLYRELINSLRLNGVKLFHGIPVCEFNQENNESLKASPAFVAYSTVFVAKGVPESLRTFIIRHEWREIALNRAGYKGTVQHWIARRKEFEDLKRAGMLDEMM
jgi:hypothetical protein